MFTTCLNHILIHQKKAMTEVINISFLFKHTINGLENTYSVKAGFDISYDENKYFCRQAWTAEEYWFFLILWDVKRRVEVKNVFVMKTDLKLVLYAHLKQFNPKKSKTNLSILSF